MSDPSESPVVEPARSSPRPPRRRRAFVAGGVALGLVVVAGVAGVGYVASVDLPEPTFATATTLYYSDGSTPLARLGDRNSDALPYASFLDVVTQAAVAAEDPDFWTDSGSAIAEAVVRNVYGLQGPRGTRMRVLMWKLERQMSKEDILERYLNTTPFGRDTYGVQAAAVAYFGKSANRGAPADRQLTTSETLMLMGLVRQPEPDPADPIGSPGNDPVVSPLARQNSVRRWGEVRAAMVERGFLAQRDADELRFPVDVRPFEADPTDGSARPAGLVVNHVLSELAERAPTLGGSSQALATGGYRVVTTIDPRLQALVEGQADHESATSVMNGQPANLQAAAVVVEPGTGRVLAYFGNHDGLGADFAGIYTLDGTTAGFGAHSPGSSFYPQVLAAALKAGVSLNSRWNSQSVQEMPGRTGDHPVRNASQCPTPGPSCTLLESTIASLTTTFYALTVSVTPVKVLELARDVGFQHMWDDQRQRLPLTGDLGALLPAHFDITLGLGQYPVTVVDQANAMATYAAGGRPAPAHFVRTVTQGERTVYSDAAAAGGSTPVLSPTTIRDLTYALSKVASASVPSTPAAGKTGTWEYFARVDQNADAWMVGFTPAYGVAVWIGNRADAQPLRDRSGATIWGSGLPASIFRGILSRATSELGVRPKYPWPDPPAFAGDEHPPGSYG